MPLLRKLQGTVVAVVHIVASSYNELSFIS